ncbi:MAG TPA: hypothetical protein VF444_24915 [Pseudonocardiaceae bacterium]
MSDALSPQEAAARFVEWFTMAPPEQTGDVVHDVVSRIRERQASDALTTTLDTESFSGELEDYDDPAEEIPTQGRGNFHHIPGIVDIYW